jgi:DNA-binding transcriptional MerR regulator
MSAANAPAVAAQGPAGPAGTSGKSTERVSPTYSISDLAQEFALTTRAIRFYEDEGLLAPLRRGQTRIYGERERTRIKLILRGKRLGLALSEIRELFDIYAATGSERPQLAKFLQMLADRRAMLCSSARTSSGLTEIGRWSATAAAGSSPRAGGREGPRGGRLTFT